MRAVDYSNLGRYRLITFNHDGVATAVIALDDCGVGWQACPELELPGYDALDFDGANVNLAIGIKAVDSVSGAAPHRCYPGQVEKLT
jgi:hypothetical protein